MKLLHQLTFCCGIALGLVGCKQLEADQLKFTNSCPQCLLEIDSLLRAEKGVYFTKREKASTIIFKFDEDDFNFTGFKKRISLDYKLFESKKVFYFQVDSIPCCKVGTAENEL